MKLCRRVQGKRRMRFNRVAIRNRNSEILTANLKTKDATSFQSFSFSAAERPRRYFAAFFLLASARRSIFFRRLARFLTLSLPWLFPIRLQYSSTCRALAMRRRILRRFQAVSFTQLPLRSPLPRAITVHVTRPTRSIRCFPVKKHPPRKRCVPLGRATRGGVTYSVSFRRV
jgi:hypothetical protein